MGKLKIGLENIGGVLDVVNNVYSTVDDGVNALEKIKSKKSFNASTQIKKNIRHIKRIFYIIWTIMITITILIWFFF